jgi:menaquinone-dependent protoporphyrinogen IX oxidase
VGRDSGGASSSVVARRPGAGCRRQTGSAARRVSVRVSRLGDVAGARGRGGSSDWSFGASIGWQYYERVILGASVLSMRHDSRASAPRHRVISRERDAALIDDLLVSRMAYSNKRTRRTPRVSHRSLDRD